MKWWDHSIVNPRGEVVFLWKELLTWEWKGQKWTLRLHKFIQPDDPGCYHTHPARAFRWILWNGYIEEIYSEYSLIEFDAGPLKVWRPGDHGWIEPEFCHRIEQILGDCSYSLWIHGPKVADIELYGKGWPDHMTFHGSTKRIRIKEPQ